MFLGLKTHFLQMKSAFLPDQRGVPAEQPYKERHPSPPSLVSALWFSSLSVIRSGKKTTSRDWQPTTGFMAVVSGGRRVSRTNEHRRDFTLPSCALTHTALPPYPAHADSFLPRRHKQITRRQSCVEMLRDGRFEYFVAVALQLFSKSGRESLQPQLRALLAVTLSVTTQSSHTKGLAPYRLRSMLRSGYFSSWHSMTKKKTMSQIKYICFSSKKNQEILPFCSLALWSI